MELEAVVLIQVTTVIEYTSMLYEGICDIYVCLIYYVHAVLLGLGETLQLISTSLRDSLQVALGVAEAAAAGDVDNRKGLLMS
jgi:hypothetical protein